MPKGIFSKHKKVQRTFKRLKYCHNDKIKCQSVLKIGVIYYVSLLFIPDFRKP